MSFIDTDELKTGERLPGWRDRSFSTETMTFAHYTFDAGSKIPEHCHLNEEVWTVIEGELEVSIGADSMVAKPGLVAVVPPYTAHSVSALTDGKAIVTDCPVRADPSGGRRSVVQILFDRPVTLAESPAWESMEIPFTLHNRGRTAAWVKGWTIEAALARVLPAPTQTRIPGGELPAHCMLAPDQSRDENVKCSQVTPQTLQGIRSGELVWYIQGAYFYDDEFGCRQHYTFCRVYDPSAFDGKGGFVKPAKPGYNYGT
jgi:quercetin dioxygenase-like cupin family protein